MQQLTGDLLEDFVNVMLGRFAFEGSLAALNDEIGFLRRSVASVPPGSLDSAVGLYGLAVGLFERFKLRRQISDLDEAIDSFRAAAEPMGSDFPGRERCFLRLGHALTVRYAETSDSEDLEEALSALAEALDSEPRESPHRPDCLVAFANALLIKWRATGALDDLIQAIEMAKDAYDRLPAVATSRFVVAAILSDALIQRYLRRASAADLQDALRLMKDAGAIGSLAEPPDALSLERLLLDVHLARDVPAVYPGSEASFVKRIEDAARLVGETGDENALFGAIAAMTTVIRERCVLKGRGDLLQDVDALLADLHGRHRHTTGEGFVAFELAFARIVLQRVLWNQGGDIERVVSLCHHVLKSCFSSGDSRSSLTAEGFDIAGDAYALREQGEQIENLQLAARFYQSCIKRVSDSSSFVRNNVLAKYSDILRRLLDRHGYHAWLRDMFCSLEEILAALPNMAGMPPETFTTRRAIAAERIFIFTRYCMWPASEFRMLVTRVFQLTDQALDDAENLGPETVSVLEGLLLAAALDCFPWLGQEILYRALGKLQEMEDTDFSGATPECLETRRDLAQIYALTGVRSNLFRARELLLEDIPQTSDREQALDHILLSAIDFLLLHDGDKLLLQEARDNLRSGLGKTLTIQNTVAGSDFRNVAELLDDLIDQATRTVTRVQAASGRGAERLSITASAGSAIQSFPLPEIGLVLWIVPIEFEPASADRRTRREVPARPEEGHRIIGTCPNCGAGYSKRIWLYINEEDHPDLFSKLARDEFWTWRCEGCPALLALSYPLYVERKWDGYPGILSVTHEPLITPGQPSAAPSADSPAVDRVVAHLASSLPEAARSRLAKALRMPSWALRVLVRLTDREPDVASILTRPLDEILSGAETDVAQDGLSLMPSCIGYENRLDPVACFPHQQKYRKSEFLAWLNAEDSEAILERRDSRSVLYATPDMRMFKEMIAGGWPLVSLGAIEGYKTTVRNHEALFLENAAHDEKASRHKEAARIVKDAVSGRGAYVLLLRTYSLKTPRLTGEEIRIDSPYGLPKAEMVEVIQHFAETLQDEVTEYIHGRFPVISASDHIQDAPITGGDCAELRVKSTEWQDVISLLIEQATYVIALFGEFTPSAEWELDHLRLLDAERKTGIFLFTRYFVHTRSAEFEDSPEYGSLITSSTWTDVLKDEQSRRRFAFVHEYSEDDESWKDCIDGLVEGTSPA